MSALVRLGAVLCLAALALAACGGDDDEAAGASLEGTQWTLSGGIDDVPDDAVPTLMLDDGSASGSGGCNNFSGPYEVDGDSLTIGPLAGTMMACEEAKMAVEAAVPPGPRGGRRVVDRRRRARALVRRRGDAPLHQLLGSGAGGEALASPPTAADQVSWS